MKKLQTLLALFAFILVAAHLMALPGLASTKSGSGAVTLAAKKASSKKIAGGRTRLPGHVLAAIKGATPVPATPRADAAPLTLTIVLKRTDQAGFDKYLHDVYDRNSPIFHHFLKPPEISDRFGPTRDAYEKILDYLRANGLELAEGSANRLTLTVRGTRAQAEHAFDVHIRYFQEGGRSFFANDTDPGVPASLAANIQAVVGLSNAPRPKTAVDSASAVFDLQQVAGWCSGDDRSSNRRKVWRLRWNWFRLRL